MEITIAFEADSFVVRDDAGGVMTGFDSMEEAANYATGLANGYNAAVSKLGRAHGFRTDRSANLQSIKMAE